MFKGRNKTSNLANKKLKSLLSNAVLAALKYDKQIASYKTRKLGENKEKGIIVSNRQTPYVKFIYA